MNAQLYRELLEQGVRITFNITVKHNITFIPHEDFVRRQEWNRHRPGASPSVNRISFEQAGQQCEAAPGIPRYFKDRWADDPADL